MTTQDIPFETDRIAGAPHPRHAQRVIGHDQAIKNFVGAADQGRLHHGWLITGPRGTGKATLAWMLARWLLAGQPQTVDVPPEAPLSRRIAALAEPRLHLVRRAIDEKTGRPRSELTVDELRKLLSFFHLSAADGGMRVAIIDSADDMNIAASNALLKMLEEPPARTVIFLISHQPAGLLPTIRSRCRTLRLSPLSADDLSLILNGLDIRDGSEQLAALSDGSIGEALRLTGQDGLERYQQIVDLFATLPRLDRPAAARLADLAGARPGPEGDPFDLIVTLLDRFLSRATRAGLHGPPLPEAARGEAELFTRISPDNRTARDWADAQARFSARARAGRAVNLDPSALVMDMLIGLAQGKPAH